MATWNASEREAAIAKGKSGGKLDSYEQQKLLEVSRQAGSVGRDAAEALRKAK